MGTRWDDEYLFLTEDNHVRAIRFLVLIVLFLKFFTRDEGGICEWFGVYRSIREVVNGTYIGDVSVGLFLNDTPPTRWLEE